MQVHRKLNDRCIGNRRANASKGSHTKSVRVFASSKKDQFIKAETQSNAVHRRQMLQSALVLGTFSVPAKSAWADEDAAQSVQVTTEAVSSDAIETSLEVVSEVSNQEIATSLPEPATEIAVTTQQNKSEVVYLDVKLEGQSLGRIQIELFPDVTIGAARFKDLAVGKQGVGYRLSRFNGIFPTYIRCEGVKSLSYSASMESPITGGDDLSLLESELSSSTRAHDTAGLVSIVVRNAEERPVTEKMIARDGKFITVQTQAGEAPNGTTFCITTAAEPTLNATNLIVGRVVGGVEVVDTIGKQPYAKPRDSYYDGPFFSVAKAIGDKRADTAEKGFNRPLKRIIVSGGGLL